MADALTVATVPAEEEQVYAGLLEQLLASFNSEKMDDLELEEWERPPKPHYHVAEQRSDPRRDPKRAFFLFKLKASAKKGQISWWSKRYARFPPERPKYKYAMRVARLVTGADGQRRLEQAGEGGQPGALSFHIPSSFDRPKPGIVKDGVPLRAVALVKRLPDGEGVSIISYVHGLGVKVGDILFLLHCITATVALSFFERDFYVSSRFTEETLYAKAGLDLIDITAPLEDLIKKLYRMYEQEEQDKKVSRA